MQLSPPGIVATFFRFVGGVFLTKKQNPLGKFEKISTAPRDRRSLSPIVAEDVLIFVRHFKFFVLCADPSKLQKHSLCPTYTLIWL